MVILDLDDVTTWNKRYSEFIRNDPYWIVIERAILNESNDDFNKILHGLENSIEHVNSKELTSLRQRCSKYFEEIYTHVAAYHACRPKDIESYFKEGLIPANTENLIAEAKKFFGDADAVSSVVNKMRTEHYGSEYFEHGLDKIGFFMSKTGSMVDSHYLKYGSELFQCIANRLGEWAIHMMSKRGTPTLIQCSLPVTWLDESATFPIRHRYALTPLIELLVFLRMPEERFPIRGAFMLKRAVPKELILNTIDMTSVIKKST